MDEVTRQLPELLKTVMGAGPWGVAAAVLLFIGFVWAKLKYEAMRKAAEEAKKSSDQAHNAPQNTTADRDAGQAEDEIEEIIKRKDT